MAFSGDPAPFNDVEWSRLEAKKPVEAASGKQIEAAKNKANQTYDFRDSFFRTVKWSLIATLAAAVVVMVLYIIADWGHLDATVLISFNSAVVVNTLGLAYIVANYLFPKGGSD